MKKIITILLFALCLALGLRYSVTYEDTLNNKTITKSYWFYEDPKTADPINSHYKFNGWHIKGSDNYNKVFHLGNTTVEAKWENKEYDIIFNLYEDERVDQSINSYRFSQYSAYELPMAYKEGYDFIAWSNGCDFYGRYIPIKYDKNLSLKPIFKAKEYKIQYELNGGYINSGFIDAYKHNQKPLLPTVIKSGYVFTGWSLSDGSSLNDFSWDRNITLIANYKRKPGNYIKVGDVDINLSYCGTQADVDKEGLGFACPIGNKFLIGDHRYQGFEIIEYLPIGSTAEYRIGNTTKTITLNSRYYSKKIDQRYFELYDGRLADDINDGPIILYTCQEGSEGEDVVLTYWS